MNRKRPPYNEMYDQARDHGVHGPFCAEAKRGEAKAGELPNMTPAKAKRIGMHGAWDKFFPPKIAPEEPKKKDVKNKQVVGNAEAIDWVFNNVAVQGLKMDDAPSAGAFGLYDWARDTPQNLSSFYSTIWKARIPTRQQVETANSLQDDPRDMDDLIGILQKAKYGKEQDETLERLEQM